MTALGEADSSLASQCLALCQTLTSQGKAFNFSLNIGSTFSFCLDTRSKEALPGGTKKKASPSTLRRNTKRREEFLLKKSKPQSDAEEREPDVESNQADTFPCDSVKTHSEKKRVWKFTRGRHTRCWLVLRRRVRHLLGLLLLFHRWKNGRKSQKICRMVSNVVDVKKFSTMKTTWTHTLRTIISALGAAIARN